MVSVLTGAGFEIVPLRNDGRTCFDWGEVSQGEEGSKEELRATMCKNEWNSALCQRGCIWNCMDVKGLQVIIRTHILANRIVQALQDSHEEVRFPPQRIS